MDNPSDIVRGSIPDINTDTIGQGSNTIEGLNIVKTVPKDEVAGGNWPHTDYVKKPYGD